MLQSISIQNYALIDNLKIDFEPGFSIITGETGAGKSILLGALSLLVGQRADSSILLDKSKKCIVEGSFYLEEYHLQDFFKQNELDYNDQTIIRREIHDNARSRAFVNDSPVNLNILKELGDRLVDIHSQHQNSYLADSSFQLKVIDVLARNTDILDKYKDCFRKFNELQKQYSELLEKSEKDKTDLDYYNFQFNELESAQLQLGEQNEIEKELKILSHAEEIKTALNNISGFLQSDPSGIVLQLKEAINLAGKIKNLFPKADGLQQRMESAYIELKDLASETEVLSESIDLDPSKMDKIKSRLDSLYFLCQKHRASNSDELISLRDSFKQKISAITGYDERLTSLNNSIEKIKDQLTVYANQITKVRQKTIPKFEEQVITLLRQLGIPNAMFSVKLESNPDFTSSGCDSVSYLFSANKQVGLQDITKVASGGEISRFMLVVKSVIASSLSIPAVIFDEIDAGVSGEIADKVGNILKQMSDNMQVISITHLPQVASKGQNHYMVYKTDGEKATNTHIKLLSGEERVVEIAKMLSGEQVSEAALTNARVLLKN